MNILDKIGSIGTVFAAFGMSCCLPLFASVGSVIGLGFLAQYEYEMFYVMQGAVVLVVLGTIWAYRSHRNILPLILAVLCAGTIIYVVNTDLNSWMIYGGMIGLIIVAGMNLILARNCKNCGIKGAQQCN